MSVGRIIGALLIAAAVIGVAVFAAYAWPSGSLAPDLIPDDNKGTARASPWSPAAINVTDVTDVTDVIDPYTGAVSYPGLKLIALEVTFTGGPPSNISMLRSWTLYTDDGDGHRYKDIYPLPSGLDRSKPVTFRLLFEIDDDLTPTKLIYNNEPVSLSVDLGDLV